MDRIQKLVKNFGLSKRQSDVLFELVKTPHATSDELAPRLGCSTSTVNVHLFKIFEKIGVKNKRELLQNVLGKESENLFATINLRKIQILLIDYDEAFAKRIVHFFGEFSPDHVQVKLFTSCHDGLAYLVKNKSGEADINYPHLILLDLEMPIEEGLACLQKIKRDEELGKIPMVLFSADSDQSLLREVYSKGSDTFVPRPEGDEELHSILRLILDYWGRVGVLPNGPRPVGK